jgi:hypothetical protein
VQLDQAELKDEEGNGEQGEQAELRVRAAADRREDGNEQSDEARRKRTEEDRERERGSGQCTSQVGLARGEVGVRLLDTERRELRGEDRNRGQERHAPPAARSERTRGDENAGE